VYDSVKVMVEAMKAADSSDPAKYLPKLKETNYKGVTGQIAFDEKGDIKNGAPDAVHVQGWQALIFMAEADQAAHLGHVARHDQGGGGIGSHLAIGVHGFFGHLQLHRLFAARLPDGGGDALDGLGRGVGHRQ
jgi:hypothetical protein